MKLWNTFNNTFKQKFPLFGISASILLLIGFLVPQKDFRNIEGQTYAILNHFISELGWVGVSKHAFIFNLCLICSGLLYAIFTYGLVRQFGGFWSKITGRLGILSSLSVTLVGIFPIQSSPVAFVFHLIAGLMFFVFAFLTFISALFMLFFDTNKIIPKSHLLVYLVVPLYIIPWLNLEYDYKLFQYVDMLEVKIINRPEVWIYSAIEWALAILALTNLFLISLYFLIRQRYNTKTAK